MSRPRSPARGSGWLVGLMLVACSSRPPTAPAADVSDVPDAAPADSLTNSFQDADVLAVSDVADATDDVDAADTLDAFNPANVPMGVTWTAAAWAGTCLPNGATATTEGPVHTYYGQCEPQACEVCAPLDKCTCEGDGGTPCAWTPIASMPFPAESMLSTWGDGKLYVWGGMRGDNDSPTLKPQYENGTAQTLEVWDPQTDSWFVTPPAPVYNGDLNPGVAFGAGKVYVMGTNVWEAKQKPSFKELPWGPDYADVAAYDPLSNIWTALPKQGSPGACGFFGRMAFLNGRLVVPGCQKWYWAIPEANVGPGATFDPSTATWSPLAPPPASGGNIPWSPEAVSGNKAAGFTYTSDGARYEFAVLDADNWSWHAYPLPPDCVNQKYGLNSATLSGFPDGFLLSVQMENFNNGAFNFVWWHATESWEFVPVPKWLTVFADRPAVWDGSKFVMWMGDGATYNPYTRIWRQMARVGMLSFRGDGVDTAWGNRVISVGGFNVGSQYVTADGASIIVPDVVK